MLLSHPHPWPVLGTDPQAAGLESMESLVPPNPHQAKWISPERMARAKLLAAVHPLTTQTLSAQPCVSRSSSHCMRPPSRPGLGALPLVPLRSVLAVATLLPGVLALSPQTTLCPAQAHGPLSHCPLTAPVGAS